GNVLIHDTIKKTVFGWLQAGLPSSLATVHPAEHRRLMDISQMSAAKITHHREIIKQVGNCEGGDILPNVTIYTCNVTLGDVRIDRQCRKNSLPFTSVRNAICIADDFHAMRCDIARHLIPETVPEVELLAVRRKPKGLIE